MRELPIQILVAPSAEVPEILAAIDEIRNRANGVGPVLTASLRSPELDALRRHADALGNAGAEVINKPQSHSARAALATAVADYTAWQIDGVV